MLKEKVYLMMEGFLYQLMEGEGWLKKLWKVMMVKA